MKEKCLLIIICDDIDEGNRIAGSWVVLVIVEVEDFMAEFIDLEDNFTAYLESDAWAKAETFGDAVAEVLKASGLTWSDLIVRDMHSDSDLYTKIPECDFAYVVRL